MGIHIKAALAAISFLAAGPSAEAETARYRLELHIYWSAATHPHDWPAHGGHLSDLTGVTHNERYVMFADGRTATTGLKLVAENGRSSILLAELEEAKRRKRTGEVFRAEGLLEVPGGMTAEFEAGAGYPLVSFVTMVAPSPDWFTGAASVELYADGAWRDRVEGLLLAWDAGTDSGAIYTAADAETQPAESIRLLATPHFLNDKGLVPVGRYVLTRVP